MIQVNRIYLIFNPVHFLVDSSDIFPHFNVVFNNLYFQGEHLDIIMEAYMPQTDKMGVKAPLILTKKFF